MPIESPRGRAARTEPDVTGRPSRPTDSQRRPLEESAVDDDHRIASQTQFTEGETVAGHLPSWVDSDLVTPASAEAVDLGEVPEIGSNPFDDDIDTDAHPRSKEVASVRFSSAPTSRIPFRALSIDPPADTGVDVHAGETVANVPIPPQRPSSGERHGSPSHPRETGRGRVDDPSDSTARGKHSPAVLFDGEHAAEAPQDVHANGPSRILAPGVPRLGTLTEERAERARGLAHASDEGEVPGQSDDLVDSGPPMLTRWRMGPSRALRAGPRAMPLGAAGAEQVNHSQASPAPVTDIGNDDDRSSANPSSARLGSSTTTDHSQDMAESSWPQELGLELIRATTLLRTLSQFGAYLGEEPREEFARRILAVHQCLQSAAALLPSTPDDHDDEDEG